MLGHGLTNQPLKRFTASGVKRFKIFLVTNPEGLGDQREDGL